MFIQTNNTNQSFLDISKQLEEEGIKNNSFFLKIFDCTLSGINPHYPNLSDNIKHNIIEECRRNFYYFIREVVRIPQQGGDSIQYQLNKGTLAMNFCMDNNLNTIAEISIMHGKNITVICRSIWEALFIDEFNISYTGKDLKDSNLSIDRTREIILALPQYIREILFKKNKYINKIEMISCTETSSEIKSISPRTILNLDHDILKGYQEFNYQRQWYDDYVFIKDISKILLKVQPKFAKVRRMPRNTIYRMELYVPLHLEIQE